MRAPGMRLVELTPEIAIESGGLAATAPGDPADRILVATARSVGARFATCDEQLLTFGADGHLAVLDARG